MSGGVRRLTEPLLECYLAGSLDARGRAEVEAVLAESEADRARLEELRAESAAFLIQHPPGPLVARFESTRRPGWRERMKWFAPLLAVAAAVVLLVVTRPWEDPYTVKGGVALVLYRKRAEGSARVAPGETLSPGDTLRFEVSSGGRSGYVAVLSRDAAGGVSVYYPYDGRAAVPHDAKTPLLPGAIELGEGGGGEVLYVLFSEKPFTLEGAVSALKEGRELASAVPEGVSVGRTSFVVRAGR